MSLKKANVFIFFLPANSNLIANSNGNRYDK